MLSPSQHIYFMLFSLKEEFFITNVLDGLIPITHYKFSVGQFILFLAGLSQSYILSNNTESWMSKRKTKFP